MPLPFSLLVAIGIILLPESPLFCLLQADPPPASPAQEFQNSSLETAGEGGLGLKADLPSGDTRLSGWFVSGTGGPFALYDGAVPAEVFPSPDGRSHLLFNVGGGDKRELSTLLGWAQILNP